MPSDAHIHLTARMEKILTREPLFVVVSCHDKTTYAKAKAFQNKQKEMEISFGIHPWYCEKETIENNWEPLEAASIIGEIGLDSVWCKVDRSIQKAVFQAQLEYACQTKKPVVLHTKGEEKTVLEMIRHYPNRYQVHWYSCKEYIDAYKDYDCYFSIGPFPSIDDAVKEVVRKVPLNRILIESDGIDAIEWAKTKTIEDFQYRSALDQIAQEIADIKQCSMDMVWKQVDQNLKRFLTGNDAC